MIECQSRYDDTALIGTQITYDRNGDYESCCVMCCGYWNGCRPQNARTYQRAWCC